MKKEIFSYLKFIDSRIPDENYHDLIVLGIRLRVYPHIWNPVRGKSSKMFIRLLKKYPLSKVRSALDLGTGSGILALILWQRGVKEIVAADKVAKAIKNAKYNFQKNKANKIKIIKSNLFSNIKEKFDLVVFNAPATHPLKRKTKRGRDSLWSPEENILKRFMDDLKNHLTRNGRALLMYSRFVDFDPLPEKLLDKYLFSYSYLIKNKGDLSEFGIIEIKKL